MRLFTGVDLPAPLSEAVDAVKEQLRPEAAIQWIPPANFHITTRFIGEWPAARLPELRAALGGIPAIAPIAIHVRELGFFPNAHAPRVFWAGVEGSAGLAALARETDGALERLGLKADGRVFSPHLTLARIKAPVPLQKLREAIAALPPPDFGCFDAASFFLYESRSSPAGSVYTKLAEFPLASCGMLGD